MTRISLELPESVLEQAEAVAKQTERAVEDVVAEWVAKGARINKVHDLLATGPHIVYTPFEFGNEAADVILQALKNANDKASS